VEVVLVVEQEQQRIGWYDWVVDDGTTLGPIVVAAADAAAVVVKLERTGRVLEMSRVSLADSVPSNSHLAVVVAVADDDDVVDVSVIWVKMMMMLMMLRREDDWDGRKRKRVVVQRRPELVVEWMMMMVRVGYVHWPVDFVKPVVVVVDAEMMLVLVVMMDDDDVDSYWVASWNHESYRLRMGHPESHCVDLLIPVVTHVG
jgi:hypothetical protein